MKIKYNYSEIITELEEEIEDGILTLDDTIQILRDDKTLYDNYYVVVDWYYSDDTMMEIIKEIENCIDIECRNDKKAIEIYFEDKENLEEVTVREILSELIEVNS